MTARRAYRIKLRPSAVKRLRRMQENQLERVDRAIISLAGDPRPRGCKKLEGMEDLWRIRVGDFRIIYQVDDKAGVVLVLRVRHRGDAYRGTRS